MCVPARACVLFPGCLLRIWSWNFYFLLIAFFISWKNVSNGFWEKVQTLEWLSLWKNLDFVRGMCIWYESPSHWFLQWEDFLESFSVDPPHSIDTWGNWGWGRKGAPPRPHSMGVGVMGPGFSSDSWSQLRGCGKLWGAQPTFSWATFKIRKGTEREKGFWSVRIRQIQAQKDGERNEWRQLICVTSFNFPQILLEQWLSTRVNLTLQGTFGSVWRCFSWSQLRREGCYCHFMDRGQDAANHPMKLKTVPITKNYLTLNATVPGLRNPAGRRAFLYTSPCNSRESSGSEGLPTA